MTVAVTEPLASFVADLRYDDLPGECTDRAKHLLLDLAGSIVRAGREADSTPTLKAALATVGLDSPGAASVVGQDWMLAPPIAALVNGMLGHSLDFDDTHAASSLHPSAPVVPAALAVAEQTGASGRDVLTAIIAGYEVACRLGNALDPTSHYARGFHPTATAGTFGAAAAAGKLYGLDAAGVAAAFGVAASQAAGSLQFLANGAWNKRWQVGEAAMNGVLAAALAKNGFVASTEPIEGGAGFLKGYTDDPHPEKAVADLGTVWETMHIGMKPYPSCRYTHAALDALAQLRAAEALDASDFEQVTIGLHRNGITLTADSLPEKRRVRSIVAGQFSMPFTAAVMIDQGRFGWDDYRRIGDPALDAISDRIDVRRDESLEGLDHPFGATVSAATSKGRFDFRVEDPPGEPKTFPDTAGIRAKFMSLAEPVLGGGAARLADDILSLDGRNSLSGGL